MSGLLDCPFGEGFGQFQPSGCQGLQAESLAGYCWILPPGCEGRHGPMLHPLQVLGLPDRQAARLDGRGRLQMHSALGLPEVANGSFVNTQLLHSP